MAVVQVDLSISLVYLICAKSLQSCLTLCNPMGCSLTGSLSMGFSKQEYWGGLPCPPPGDLRDPGIEPTAVTSPALTGWFFTISATWESGLTLCVLEDSGH